MLKLVKAHFHKDRAVLLAFLLILIVASMLLQVSLMVAQYDPMFDEKCARNGICDALYICAGNREVIEGCIDDQDYVDHYSVAQSIFPDVFTMSVNEGKEKETDDLFLIDEDNVADYQDLDYVEIDDSITGPAISINVYTASAEGIKVGDKIRLGNPELGDHEFTVKGIYEDLFCGQRYSYCSTVIDHSSYSEISSKVDSMDLEKQLLFRRLFIGVFFDEGEDFESRTSLLQEEIQKTAGYCNASSRSLIKAGYIGVTNIMAAFMASFSVIMIVIALIMIIFTVNTNINRDIRNIGALRAVGFTISQVRISLMIEYALVGALAGIIGITSAYMLFPSLEELALKQLSGLAWEGGFKPGISLSLFAGIIAAMLLVTFTATHLIRNIHPATALRFGLESHSFKKNHLPLEKTNGDLNVLLALKSTLQNKGQNIIITGVILAVSFITAFSSILFYNTKIDITRFQRLLQGDAPDAYVYIKYDSPEEMNDIIETIQDMDVVTEAYGLTSTDAHVGDYNCYLIYTNKPQFVYCGVYEGEMAMEANEAIVGGILAEKLGIGIGDEITVSYMGNEASFLITGLQQAVYSMGERIYISGEGFERLGGEEDYSYVRVRIDGATDEKVDAFLEDVKAELGSSCTGTENYYHSQRSSENIPVFAVSLVILILIALNIFTVIIVIRLLMKTIFIKREKEFGIKKAVGFTSRQLRIQLALSLTPISIIGSILGGIAACLTTNSLFNLIFTSYGIKNSDLLINPVVIPVSAAIVTVMVYVISFIMSGRMKKVSAYQLISE